MKVDIRKQNINFFDDLNFPKGFRRSGLFTVLEAEFLTQNGHLMAALANEQLSPQNDQEEEFVAAINSGIPSSQLSVKVWKKYLQAIENQRSNRIFMSHYCLGQMATNC